LNTTRRQRIAGLLLWITPALWSSNYIIARAADGVIESRPRKSEHGLKWKGCSEGRG